MMADRSSVEEEMMERLSLNTLSEREVREHEVRAHSSGPRQGANCEPSHSEAPVFLFTCTDALRLNFAGNADREGESGGIRGRAEAGEQKSASLHRYTFPAFSRSLGPSGRRESEP